MYADYMSQNRVALALPHFQDAAAEARTSYFSSLYLGAGPVSETSPSLCEWLATGAQMRSVQGRAFDSNQRLRMGDHFILPTKKGAIPAVRSKQKSIASGPSPRVGTAGGAPEARGLLPTWTSSPSKMPSASVSALSGSVP